MQRFIKQFLTSAIAVA